MTKTPRQTVTETPRQTVTETPEQLMHRAVSAHRTGDTAGAETLYRAFLDRFGPAPEVLNNLAGLCYQRDAWADAADLYQRTIQTGARHPVVFANLARALHRQGQAADAAAAFEQALALDPADAAIWNDMGNARFDAGDPKGAAKAYERAVRHKPDFARAHNNLGNTRRVLNDPERALTSYEAACDLVADTDAEAGELHTNRAHALLALGRWQDGFDAYRWRWRKPGVPRPPKTHAPEWDGVLTAGTRIAIVAEQGFGDSLLGLRFAQVLADHGMIVGAVVPPALVRTAGAVRGVSWSVAGHASLEGLSDAPPEGPSEGPYPEHDCQVLAMDLPGLLNARPDAVPGSVPYLDIPARPTVGGPLRVGLTWAGNPLQSDDANRSFGFAALEPILAVPGLDLVSLQVGERAGDADDRVANGVTDVTDFLDTADVIADLDVVIAVDSAVAHLAGAMGHRVWVPLTRIPDWRYGLASHASPFFPSMRLYRQEERGIWSTPMQRIAADLAALRDSRS